MKTNGIVWWKLIAFMLLTAFFIYSTKECFLMTKWAHGDMIVNWRNVQERMYEAIHMFFTSAQFLILSTSLLVVSVCGLVRTIIPSEGSGKIGCFMGRHGLIVTIVFAVLFILLFLFAAAAIVRIRNTAEINEVPAALHDHLLLGWLGIVAEVSAESAVLSLILWIRNKP